MEAKITMKTTLLDLLKCGVRIELPNGYWFRRYAMPPDAMKRFKDYIKDISPATQAFLYSNSPNHERLFECGIGENRCEFFWSLDDEGLKAAMFELSFREKKWPT